MDGFKFPEGFVLGVSSAATQIEGGDIRTNWHDWAKTPGHIKDGSGPDVANMHWDKWKEDDTLMAKMGIKHARIGFEWARIEPAPGEFSEEGMQHYIDELEFMKKKGIEPLLTLHHFSNPSWFEEMGAFEKYENVQYFMEYAQYVVEHVKDYVRYFITINEPNVYAYNGYFGVGFPPGKNDIKLYFEVLSNLADAHIQCYKMIHKILPDAKVSAAVHMAAFQPLDSRNPIHLGLVKFGEHSFQTAICNAMALGKLMAPLKKRPNIQRGEYCDFWGMNYYSRQTVSDTAGGVDQDCRVNDLGWEIYPEGIVVCARKLYKILKRDIWITENGTCDTTDKWRSRYIYDHLRVILGSDLPIKRYYHWCFLDNWEWLEGESARFGLVHVNYETQKRRTKQSGKFYSELIKNNGCTQEMYDKYVAGQEYKKQDQ